MSTISQPLKEIKLIELIEKIRTPEYGGVSLTMNGYQIHITAEDWNYILDAAQDKLNRGA